MYTLLVTGDVPGAATYFNPLLQQTTIPCTSGTRPTPSHDGMQIYETDTDKHATWNGTLWVYGTRQSVAQTVDTGNFSTTETVVLTLNTTVVNGMKYRITAQARPVANAVGSPSNESCILRIREDNTAGNQIQAGQVYLASTSAVGYVGALYTEYTAVATGAKSFVLTGQRGTGANTQYVTGSGNSPGYLAIDFVTL